MAKFDRKTSFSTKLQDILNSHKFDSIIKINQSGTQLQILDKELLQIKILPTYFRHKHFSSFLRQLNFYGFKRIRTENNLKFTHPLLIKGKKIGQLKTKKKIKSSLQGQINENSINQGTQQQVRQESLSQQQSQNIIEHNENISFWFWMPMFNPQNSEYCLYLRNNQSEFAQMSPYLFPNYFQCFNQ